MNDINFEKYVSCFNYDNSLRIRSCWWVLCPLIVSRTTQSNIPLGLARYTSPKSPLPKSITVWRSFRGKCSLSTESLLFFDVTDSVSEEPADGSNLLLGSSPEPPVTPPSKPSSSIEPPPTEVLTSDIQLLPLITYNSLFTTNNSWWGGLISKAYSPDMTYRYWICIKQSYRLHSPIFYVKDEDPLANLCNSSS